MTDEIRKIADSLFQIGSVEKVKEVTPRPEERKDGSSSYNNVDSTKDKKKDKKTPSKEETAGKDRKEAKSRIDVIV